MVSTTLVGFRVLRAGLYRVDAWSIQHGQGGQYSIAIQRNDEDIALGPLRSLPLSPNQVWKVAIDGAMAVARVEAAPAYFLQLDLLEIDCPRPAPLRAATRRAANGSRGVGVGARGVGEKLRGAAGHARPRAARERRTGL